MAQIIGTSEAWDSVCRKMKVMGFYPEKISDISKILDNEKKKLEAESDVKNKLLEKEAQDFSEKKARLDDEYQKAIASAKEKIISRIKRHSVEIKHLQTPTSFFKRIKRRFQIAEEKRKIKAIKKKSSAYFKRLKIKRDTLLKNLEQEHKQNQFNIEKKAKKIEANISLLQEIRTSPELFGAVAEIELIDKLTSLPENYYVLNDVFLSLPRAMYFDNSWRRTAQIDTLVISPAGIFVIEVKNWGKSFVKSNNYHDPYDQVKWAAYLSYRQSNIKTRSIIAHTGNIPLKPNGSYTKVLQIDEVKNYILYFDKKVIINNDDIKELAHYFKPR